MKPATVIPRCSSCERSATSPDAEVGEHRVPGAVGPLPHEDVAGLDVLVDDAHRMGRRDGGGDLRHQPHPLPEIQRRKAAVSLGPVAEVAPFHILAFEKKRRLVQLHLEQPGDVRAVAESLDEQPAERQLALERAEPAGIEAELEDPKPARSLVPRDPDLAKPSLAQLPLDEPARPARDLLPAARAAIPASSPARPSRPAAPAPSPWALPAVPGPPRPPRTLRAIPPSRSSGTARASATATRPRRRRPRAEP